MRANVTPSTLEKRVLTVGLEVLVTAALWLLAFKLVLWSSVVVHEEPASIHRLFFGRWVVRFPQEPVTFVDVVTSLFLMIGGAAALIHAAWLASPAHPLHPGRRFWSLAGIGLVWLGMDELFTLHEFLSANLFVNDNAILAVYATVAVVAAAAYWRALASSPTGFAVLAVGAAFHGSALAFDFLQDRYGWLPEEPFEMLGAGFYCLAMAVYLARSAQPAAAAVREPARTDMRPDPSWARVPGQSA
jgi:hypothetical protein